MVRIFQTIVGEVNWLNYHHLYYFWAVAKNGSLTEACKTLRLAKPTVSGQIRRLEEVLGEKLFQKRGRHLEMTEIGRVTFQHAEEIFSTGHELMNVLQGKPTHRPTRIAIGIAGVLAKPIVQKLLKPALQLSRPTAIICNEDRSLEQFIAQLTMHELDVVFSDAPAGPFSGKRVFSHLLGACGTTFFAKRTLKRSLKGTFPNCLHNQAILLPTQKSMLRKSLDQWFYEKNLHPRVVGEFDDPALMDICGQAGMGIFPGPSVIESDLKKRYQVEVLGRVKTLRHRFYALSIDKKLNNPAVVAICESARRDLFN